MEGWKNHIRARLQQRDLKEKHPYDGVFSRLSQLEELFESRTHILADIQSRSLNQHVEDDRTAKFLQLQLRESEQLADKLSQTVSDLTTVLYLKEAELQYWQSRVSQYRQEALTLAKAKKDMKASLLELEYAAECQSKELVWLRSEQQRLKAALEETQSYGERLLQRWIEEKMGEAERLNKHNDMQERWQSLSKQLKKHLQRERGKQSAP